MGRCGDGAGLGSQPQHVRRKVARGEVLIACCPPSRSLLAQSSYPQQQVLPAAWSTFAATLRSTAAVSLTTCLPPHDTSCVLTPATHALFLRPGTYCGQRVAVKLFRGDVSPDGRTAEEVGMACAVSHPHLPRVRARLGSREATQGLVLDYVEGAPLAAKPTSQHLLRCK